MLRRRDLLVAVSVSISYYCYGGAGRVSEASRHLRRRGAFREGVDGTGQDGRHGQETIALAAGGAGVDEEDHPSLLVGSGARGGLSEEESQYFGEIEARCCCADQEPDHVTRSWGLSTNFGWSRGIFF
jgi:hypothetical protein